MPDVSEDVHSNEEATSQQKSENTNTFQIDFQSQASIFLRQGITSFKKEYPYEF